VVAGRARGVAQLGRAGSPAGVVGGRAARRRGAAGRGGGRGGGGLHPFQAAQVAYTTTRLSAPTSPLSLSVQRAARDTVTASPSYGRLPRLARLLVVATVTTQSTHRRHIVAAV
jgi:hypothetical protein